MGSINLPAMKTDPKFIFFTDFDGTITLQDSKSLIRSSNERLSYLLYLFSSILTELPGNDFMVKLPQEFLSR